MRHCCDSLSSISSVGTKACLGFFVGWLSSSAASSVGPRGRCLVWERPLACSHTFFSLIWQPELDYQSTNEAKEEGGAEKVAEDVDVLFLLPSGGPRGLWGCRTGWVVGGGRKAGEGGAWEGSALGGEDARPAGEVLDR